MPLMYGKKAVLNPTGPTTQTSAGITAMVKEHYDSTVANDGKKMQLLIRLLLEMFVKVGSSVHLSGNMYTEKRLGFGEKSEKEEHTTSASAQTCLVCVIGSITITKYYYNKDSRRRCTHV